MKSDLMHKVDPAGVLSQLWNDLIWGLYIAEVAILRNIEKFAAGLEQRNTFGPKGLDWRAWRVKKPIKRSMFINNEPVTLRYLQHYKSCCWTWRVTADGLRVLEERGYCWSIQVHVYPKLPFRCHSKQLSQTVCLGLHYALPMYYVVGGTIVPK